MADAARAPRVHQPREAPIGLEAAIDYLALNGHGERVYAALGQLSEDQRWRVATPRVLRQGVVGGMAALHALPPGAPARAAHAALVAELVARQEGLESGHPSRELLRTLIDWSRFLFAEARFAEAERTAEKGLQASLGFPDLHGRMVIEKAACLSARGDHAGTFTVLHGLFRRYDLVAERGLVPDLALALGQAALLTGRVADFKRTVFAALRSFFTSLESRRALFELLRRTYRGRLGVLRGDATPRDKVVFAAHWAGFACVRAAGPARALAERALLGSIYAARYALGRGVPRRGAGGQALVTRAMGGIGDLLMMTPGLHALRRSLRQPVRLAIPRRYFPLFEGNPDVIAVDIHGEQDPRSEPLWFNLTDCPAARVESLTAPRIRRNRIEIFARALGIRGRALRSMDRRPRYFVSEEERHLRRAFFARHGLGGRAVVGVQSQADEGYRDYPHMDALVRALAREHPVLVFTAAPGGAPPLPGVVRVEGRPLREAFALASGCSAIVSPDSAFLHLAAALALPGVGLFGPTDSRVRAADYPFCRTLDARRALPCVPCWRNEEIPCALTGLRGSVCLGEIAVEDVTQAVREALAQGAARGAP
jgi:hypothetical protein